MHRRPLQLSPNDKSQSKIALDTSEIQEDKLKGNEVQKKIVLATYETMET